jgi:endoribonuclease Dicer
MTQVDSVALVFQQHAVLKANLDQPMDMFCGDMGVDLWNQKIWEKHFNDNMVIVCTAEVLRQCLHHSFISIDQINLLIFDEAHHAKKDHAYARIIKDFYASKDIDKSLCPRIFGMTASPVDTRVDVRKAAAQLEGLLHCEIATAKDGLLDPYKITSQQELLAKYSALGPKVETPLYKAMYEIFKTNPIFNKPLLYSHDASRELGTGCSDQIWSFCLGEEESKKLLAKTERAYHAKRVSGPLEILEKDKSQLRNAQELVKSWIFDHPHFDGSSSSRNLSSKVVLLIQYLRERFERKTDDKAIVFVRQRYTARLLADLFSHSNIRTPHIRVGILVSYYIYVIIGHFHTDLSRIDWHTKRRCG